MGAPGLTQMWARSAGVVKAGVELDYCGWEGAEWCDRLKVCRVWYVIVSL